MQQPRFMCRLRIFADYHQFYVWDPDASGRRAPEDWSDQDIANRAKVISGVVVICPARNADVPVEVSVWDAEPQVLYNQWQHVIEAPLQTTGRIEIHECTGEAQADFTVKPGDYTVRALYQKLDTVSEDGLEGEDIYEIQVWKAACPGLRVLRQWD